jgi:hypothetical protein
MLPSCRTRRRAGPDGGKARPRNTRGMPGWRACAGECRAHAQHHRSDRAQSYRHSDISHQSHSEPERSPVCRRSPSPGSNACALDLFGRDRRHLPPAIGCFLIAVSLERSRLMAQLYVRDWRLIPRFVVVNLLRLTFSAPAAYSCGATDARAPAIGGDASPLHIELLAEMIADLDDHRDAFGIAGLGLRRLVGVGAKFARNPRCGARQS